MQLSFEKERASRYTSPTQRIRILSEHWVSREVYCPNCGRCRIDGYPNNNPAADFFCGACKEDYELKSQRRPFGTRIVDGAYKTMLNRLEASRNANFFLLHYDLQTDWR
jgi:type II restriction enzyme